MARDINLNSSTWCDVVFEGKNKSYGAYDMRQTSSRRHIVAFGCTLIFFTALVFLPSLLKAVSSSKDQLGGIDGVVTISDIPVEETPIQDEIIKEILPPPEVLLKSVEKFTPPVIVENTEVTPENEMKPQTELGKSNAIGNFRVEGTYDPSAVDPRTIEVHRAVIQEKTETPRDFVEVMPQFPGGDAEMTRFLHGNIKYPTIAAQNGIQGRVTLRFVVGKDGLISDVKILKSVDPSLDSEAMRVVKMMPKWIAGKQNGYTVPVYFTLPVTFKLSN